MLRRVQGLLSYDRVSKKLLPTPVPAGLYEITFLLPEKSSQNRTMPLNSRHLTQSPDAPNCPYDEISAENVPK